ncbi:MAG: hypothetical protein AB2693_31385 [Candidatus Thiodiazotropha sp.]
MKKTVSVCNDRLKQLRKPFYIFQAMQNEKHQNISVEHQVIQLHNEGRSMSFDNVSRIESVKAAHVWQRPSCIFTGVSFHAAIKNIDFNDDAPSEQVARNKLWSLTTKKVIIV